MEQMYTKADHEKFTADMLAHVNANHEEAVERYAKKSARAEWKALLRQRRKGLLKAYGAVTVASLVCLLHSISEWFPVWLLTAVVAACLLVVGIEFVAAIKRAPAIASAYERKEGRGE